jgi:integrase
MARFGVRSGSLNDSPKEVIPVDHAGWTNGANGCERLRQLDKLGVDGSRPVPPTRESRANRDALMFTTANGGPQSRRNALRAVRDAGDGAGLNPEGVEPIGLHDLRLSLFVLALDVGASLPQAALLARHAGAKVTAQVDAGLSDKAKAEATAKLIDAGFGA